MSGERFISRCIYFGALLKSFAPHFTMTIAIIYIINRHPFTPNYQPQNDTYISYLREMSQLCEKLPCCILNVKRPREASPAQARILWMNDFLFTRCFFFFVVVVVVVILSSDWANVKWRPFRHHHTPTHEYLIETSANRKVKRRPWGCGVAIRQAQITIFK